jgi:hypothetical protein
MLNWRIQRVGRLYIKYINQRKPIPVNKNIITKRDKVTRKLLIVCTLIARP